VLSLWLGPSLIKKLKSLQVGQNVRELGPESHMVKNGTPTMGGLLIVFSISISVLMWANITSLHILVALFVLLAFSLIGFIDDYTKVIKKSSDGLSARWKLALQVIFALLVVVYLYHVHLPDSTKLFIPFVKGYYLDIGSMFIVLALFVIVGSSNAVNLTDGLDGLALMPIVLVAMGLALFCYLSGNSVFSRYLYIPFLRGAGEMTVFCSSIAGSGLGFLWYNTYPADVFMGDIGSLGLGATLGVIAVMVRQELVFFIMGGVFVAETISVILQVASFKLTGRRVFRMAPLHHHFELKGWSEPKVIVRFWIITVILVLLGLATLKLR